MKYKKYEIEGPIETSIVSSALIASIGIANGRNIPLVIVSPDCNHIIEDTISLHNEVQSGHTSSQWASSLNKDVIYLILKFSDPVTNKIIISFDVIKYLRTRRDRRNSRHH